MSLSHMERPVSMSPEAVDAAFAGQVELYNAEVEAEQKTQEMWAAVGAKAIDSALAPRLSSEQHQIDQAYDAALESQLDATFGTRG